MLQRRHLIDPPESSEAQLQALPSDSSSKVHHDASHLVSPVDGSYDLDEFSSELVRNLTSNTRALLSRFIQLVRKPDLLAPLILDIYSHAMSVLSRRESGVDFLYPMSSLMKQKSGRLARLIIEHSRSPRHLSLHKATSRKAGVDPPCVAVMDLNRVSSRVIKRGYSVPADIYGFVIMLIIFQTLCSLLQHIFIPIHMEFNANLICSSVGPWLNEWSSSWLCYFSGTVFSFIGNWGVWCFAVLLLWYYAAYRGDGVLTLVQKSSLSTPDYAVFMDRGFTVILTGSQSTVEAVAESNFAIFHSTPWEFQREGLQTVQLFCYEALKASCKGFLLAVMAGCWLLFHPSSLLSGLALPLVPVTMMSVLWSRGEFPGLKRSLRSYEDDDDTLAFAGFFLGVLPPYYLVVFYQLAIVKQPVVASVFDAKQLLHLIPMIPFAFLVISSRDFHIRTTKFLDILGNPQVVRWEFDTLAATATFQCLVLCHNIPRPIKSMNVLGLLDTFIPDQTDVWKAWKRRVADRIAHEDEKKLSFAPTLPAFGDERQTHLKELLEEAQKGHGEYKDFYHREFQYLRGPKARVPA